MKVLGFDTSTMMVTCGLIEEDTILGESALQGQFTHSEVLLNMVEEMLNNAAIPLSEIDALAVGLGPGSFTGLRIAVTAGKILSQVTGIPIKGVSSLAALIYQVEGEGMIVPVINARRNRLYRGIFERKGERILRHSQDDAIPMDVMADELSAYEHVTFIGEGTALAQSYLGERLSASYISPLNGQIRGSSIALLGRDLFQEEGFDNLYTLEPNYLRPSQAEREWRKKHGPSPHF